MVDRERWVRWIARAAAALALCPPVIASAQATLDAKGDTIHGHVFDLNPGGVVFEPASGKGAITVAWPDVQSLETQDSYVVLHGEEGEVRGRILGVEEGELESKFLLIGDSPANAQRVDVSTLFHAYDLSKATGSWSEQMRSRMRYWKATVDLGAAYTNSTTDTASAATAIFIERKKDPTRFEFDAGQRYAQEHKPHEGTSITEDTLFAFARGEYNLTDSIYGYGSVRFTHDNQQALALRSEPRAGAGYYWIKSKEKNFSTDLGVAWISETYFGDEGVFPNEHARGYNQFWSLAFGAQGDAQLPYGALLRGRAEYLPAVDDWSHDYLLRAETSVDFPLLDWLAFKIAIADEYDNTPAPGAQHNRFSTTGGLSIRFIP